MFEKTTMPNQVIKAKAFLLCYSHIVFKLFHFFYNALDKFLQCFRQIFTML